MSTFGEDLRRERELREISLREVSQATKINLRYLEALERNDFSHLPGGVFNRGFVRAYCQFIGVDSEAMVDAYMLEMQAQTDGRGAAHDTGLLRGLGRGREESDEPPAPRPRRVGVLWGIVVLTAIVIAGSLYVYLQLVRDDDGRRATPAPGEQSLHFAGRPDVG